MRDTPTLALVVLMLAPAAAGQGAPTFNDLVIGQAPLDAGGSVAVRMDLRIPAGASGPVPVVLWIHGGGWQSGDHDSLPVFVQPLLLSGIAVATVDYRLSSEAIFPAQIEDVKGAVRFLRANAATFGIDAARIGCWGSSAGGHLSALLATSGGVAGCEGSTGGNLDQPSTVLAAVDYFGPTDIVQMNLDVTNPPGSATNHDAPSSAESRLIGYDGTGEGIGVLRANFANPNAPFPALAALANLLNPITHIDANDPPLFVAHGELDTTVPRNQSVRLVAALVAAHVEHEWRSVPAAGHGALGNAIYAETREFLVLRLGDCNGNGISDASDIAAGNSLDTNANAIPDECEPCTNVIAYCTAGTTSSGCVPALATLGVPSAAASSGFTVRATGVEGQKTGLLFYGTSGPKSAAWAPGNSSFLCVKAPTQRTNSQSTGGAAGACDGMLSLDVRSWLATHPAALGMPLASGEIYNWQGWFRDPLAAGTTNLTNAVQVRYCP